MAENLERRCCRLNLVALFELLDQKGEKVSIFLFFRRKISTAIQRFQLSNVLLVFFFRVNDVRWLLGY